MTKIQTVLQNQRGPVLDRILGDFLAADRYEVFGYRSGTNRGPILSVLKWTLDPFYPIFRAISLELSRES